MRRQRLLEAGIAHGEVLRSMVETAELGLARGHAAAPAAALVDQRHAPASARELQQRS